MSGVQQPLRSKQRFFLHYPQGHRLYVCVVDQKRYAFDFNDNTFKPGNKLASIQDACAYAESQLNERAEHGCSYWVEIDLSRLLKGTNPETIPADGALVTVHWLQQVGEHPDVTVDKRLTHSCSLRNVGGRFEPANKWDADRLDEARAFEQRARQEKEYREFTLREIDTQAARRLRLATAVREGNVSGVLRVLAEDICNWAGNIKQHLLHQVSHLAKDPFFVRTRMVPEDAPFRVFETWAVRDWIGSHEAYDLLEFHKSADFARSFSARLDRLHEARVEFSRQVIEYTVQTRGEEVEGVFVLDEARKDLKHMALCLAEYLDVIAQQFEASDSTLGVGARQGRNGNGPAAPQQEVDSHLMLEQFIKSLAAYTGMVNQIILEANHPEIESFDDAVKWTRSRSAELSAAHHRAERLVGAHLVSAIVPPPGTDREQWSVQLLAMLSDCTSAISYLFTSGPPQSASDDPRAEMAASVVSQQLEVASNLVRDIDSRRRHLEAICHARRPAGNSHPVKASESVKEPAGDRLLDGLVSVAEQPETTVAGDLEPKTFNGGEVVFYSDRVEICGVDICSGPRRASRRIVLELLSRRRNNGSFVAYSGDDLAAEAKKNGARGDVGRWIDDLRDDIMEGLRNHAGLISGHKELILSGGPGYRFAECLTVKYVDPPRITDITDTEEAGDVLNGDVRDVFDVRDDAAAAPRRAWILQELGKERKLKAPDVVRQFSCSLKTAQRDLAALKHEGKIEFDGDSRTGHYRLCQAAGP